MKEQTLIHSLIISYMLVMAVEDSHINIKILAARPSMKHKLLRDIQQESVRKNQESAICKLEIEKKKKDKDCCEKRSERK